MTEITDQHDQNSPGDLDDHSVGNGNGGESRGVKRPRPSAPDDDDDDDEKGGRERRKIEIKFIKDKSRRHITFSKRKAGIMKKVTCDVAFPRPQHHRCHDFVLMHWLYGVGLRAFCPHRNPSPPTRRLGDGLGLHVHDSETAATGYQSRG